MLRLRMASLQQLVWLTLESYGLNSQSNTCSMPITNEEIYEKLTDFHSEFTEFRGEIKTRMDHVEKEVADAKFWENVKIFTVVPVVAGLHQIAVAAGWIKK